MIQRSKSTTSLGLGDIRPYYRNTIMITKFSEPILATTAHTHPTITHPAGQYAAICILTDVFAYTEDNFPIRRLRFGTTAPRPDGRPFIIERRFRCPFHKSNSLLAFIDAWQVGALHPSESWANFPWRTLIGKAATLTVDLADHLSGRTVACITKIAPCDQNLVAGLRQELMKSPAVPS